MRRLLKGYDRHTQNYGLCLCRADGSLIPLLTTAAKQNPIIFIFQLKKEKRELNQGENR